MASTYTGLAVGSLKIRRYGDYGGVDFTDDIVSLRRSPDSLNMWKNYKTLGKGIETRPSEELQQELDNDIYGLFFYTINRVDYQIIHCGTSLYLYNTETKEKTTLLASGMNPSKSQAFIFNNKFYLLDGLHYYQYDGTTISEVVGRVPTTAISCKPDGSGTSFEDVNLLTSHRINTFKGDGKTKQYRLHGVKEIDSIVAVWLWNKNTNAWVLQNPSTYTENLVNGYITFNTAPEEVYGSDNVKIEFTKNILGHRERINQCNKAIVYDNNVFFTGNVDYPNNLFFTAVNSPDYVPELNYITDGTEESQIKGLAVGNGALWSFKEPNQNNTTIFYHQPMQTEEAVGEYEYVTRTGYPTISSTISTGCIATGTNFSDDIVFFSNRGMEGIQNSLQKEQVLGHRSSFVDRKLLNEVNYKDMSLVEWEGYLLVVIDDKVYLADSRQKTSVDGHFEYEWYYWKLDKEIEYATANKDILYLCSKAEQVKDENEYLKYTDGTNIYWYDKENNIVYDSTYTEALVDVATLTKVVVSGIYTLTNTDEDRTIESYWTTPKDDFDYPQMLKTTNKRGFKTEMSGESAELLVATDSGEFESLGSFINTKNYIVCKVKRKKWNKIQIKISSNKPIGVYGTTLEAYIGSYVKRS